MPTVIIAPRPFGVSIIVPLANLHPLVASFPDPAWAEPYSSVRSVATLLDTTGAIQPGLNPVTVTIQYPDGTTATYSLNNGILDNGDGTYSCLYQTKGPGYIRELWSFTSIAGIVATAENELPVVY